MGGLRGSGDSGGEADRETEVEPVGSIDLLFPNRRADLGAHVPERDVVALGPRVREQALAPLVLCGRAEVTEGRAPDHLEHATLLGAGQTEGVARGEEQALELLAGEEPAVDAVDIPPDHRAARRASGLVDQDEPGVLVFYANLFETNDLGHWLPLSRQLPVDEMQCVKSREYSPAQART